MGTTTPLFEAPASATAFRLLLISTALSSVVFVEPSPTDLLIVLAALLVGLLARPVLMKFQLPAVLLCVVLLLANALSLLNADEFERAVRYAVITAYVMLGFGLVLVIGNRARHGIFEPIMNMWTIAAMIAVIPSVLAYAGILPIPELLMYGRIKGLFKDPNVLGPFLVPPLTYFVMRLLTTRRSLPLTLTLAALLSTGVILSLSRAAWANGAIAIAAVGVLLAAQHVGRIKRLTFRRGFTFIITAIVVAVAVAQLPGATTLIEQRSALQHYDEERFGVQRAAITEALEEPLGAGPGQSEVIFSYAVHSTYVRVLAENGFLGAVAFLLLLGLSAHRTVSAAIRGDHRHVVLAAALLGLLVNSAFVDTIHWRHFWLLLALIWIPTGNPTGARATPTKGIPR